MTYRPARRAPGRALWGGARPRRHHVGVLVGQGVVGLDTSSGIDVRPTSPTSPAPPRAAGCGAPGRRGGAAGSPRRRAGKALRQLEALVGEVAVGDEVAVPVQGDRALLVGEVTGE